MAKTIHPMTWVASAYFAEGLPFVALSIASVIMFADLGVDEATITFWTSLLILPYTIKPLWSPLLELYFTKKGFAVTMEIVSGLCFVTMALSLGLPDWFVAVVALMSVIAFAGATNDIATDGIYLTALDKRMQSRYIGWQGAFYNLAKILVNGGLVYLAGQLIVGYTLAGDANPAQAAWRVILLIMGALMVGIALFHIGFLPTGSHNEKSPESFTSAMKSLWSVFREFFTKRHILIYITFIICYRLVEGFAIKMVPLFLKASPDAGGLGLSNQSIGLIYGTLGTGAFIAGSIAGGYFTSHFGLRRALFPLVCIFNIPFVLYYLLAVYQPSELLPVGTALVAEYFCYGFGFVGLTLFMMQEVAAGSHPMAHYTFASGIMNLGFMIPGMISGWAFQHLGYEKFFLVALSMSIPAFVLAMKIPFNNNNDKHTLSND